MKIQRSQHDMAIGNAVDGETFFSELLEQDKG